jgi:hypothetical protein
MPTSSMIKGEEGQSLSASDILPNARKLSGYLKEKSDSIDEARRLPAEVSLAG